MSGPIKNFRGKNFYHTPLFRAGLPCVLLLCAAAAPARAQMFLGAELGPDSLTRTEEAKLNQQDEDIFARAFVLENSTAALYAVFESTNLARAAASYLRRGVYRRELLILYAIARDSKTPLKALSKDRDKGASLRKLAADNKADLMKIFGESEELQKRIDIRAAFIDVSSAALAVEISSASPAIGVSTPTPAASRYEKK
ncbi:MAG: hypothetical protein WCW52_00315 [Elusimicrobiales bacterium]|jgi:hypothetical protein